MIRSARWTAASGFQRPGHRAARIAATIASTRLRPSSSLHLQAQGVRITTGTIVDATILHAPTSTKNREQQRDPEHQTKKGKQWYFGMKAHVG
jgi:IS5 family transposase